VVWRLPAAIPTSAQPLDGLHAGVQADPRSWRMAGYPAIQAGESPASVLAGSHRQRFLLYSIVLALVATVAMNLILVLSMGARGTGIALLFSELCPCS
jgi:Na+-driven multidrug efflux pump